MVISNLNFIISKLIQLAVLYPVIQQFSHIQLQVLALICLISVAMVYVGSLIRKNISQAVFKQIVFYFTGSYGYLRNCSRIIHHLKTACID